MKRICLLLVCLAAAPLAGTWASASETEPDPEIFQARRQAVMDSLDGGVTVLFGKDGEDPLIQDAAFYYLTGVSDPGAALLLAPGEHRYREILYLRPRNPEVEDWDGRRPSLGDSLEQALGFEKVRRTDRLPRDLTAFLQRSKKAVFLGPIVSAAAEPPRALTLLRDAQSRVPGSSLENKADLLPGMRRIKENREIAWIQKAVDITGKGIEAAMQAVEPGMTEFQLQSILEHTYEMEGAQFLGFSTITAWGPNTTVLHYQRNDRSIGDSGLMLIDTGAAWLHYGADVSRTFPVNGAFTPRERELYELVLRAADAAIQKVRVGADYYNDVHLTARDISWDSTCTTPGTTTAPWKPAW